MVRLVRERAGAQGLTFRELIEIVGPKGHVFLSLFLVLPFLQPIPLPGISTAFGLVIAFLGLSLALGQKPWIPERFAHRHLEGRLLLKICSGLEETTKKLERFIKPRHAWLFETTWIFRLNGVLLALHAVIMSLPLPIPFSNFLPALVIFLFALGNLEEDGWVIFAAYLAVIANAAFFATLVLIPLALA